VTDRSKTCFLLVENYKYATKLLRSSQCKYSTEKMFPQLSGFVFLALVLLVQANPYVGTSLAYYANLPSSLNVTMERRTATNVWPTPPTTISLSKAMTIAAGTTFTPAQPYTRYDRGAGACTEQAEGVINRPLWSVSECLSTQ
jgi:hypothetical protein